MESDIQLYRRINPRESSLIKSIVQRREPILFLGDSGTRKTSTVELLLKELSAQSYLVHAEKSRYRKHKDNWNLIENLPVNPIRCMGFNKREIEDYVDNYLIPRLNGNVLVIEDLKELYSRGDSRRKKYIIDAMLSKVRYLVMATTQDIADTITYETARYFPIIVLYSLRIIDNLAKLSSSRAFYREIDRRRTFLADGHYIFIRPTQTLISEKSYSWDNIEPIINVMTDGIQSVGCYSPREKIGKKNNIDRETRYVQIAKIFYENPKFTYGNISQRLIKEGGGSVEESTIGVIVGRCKNMGYLPKLPKEQWSKESIGACLINKGVELK